MRLQQNRVGTGIDGMPSCHYHGPTDVLEAEAPDPAPYDDPHLKSYYEHRGEDMGPARHRKDWT